MTMPEPDKHGLIITGSSSIIQRMDQRLELVTRLIRQIQDKESSRKNVALRQVCSRFRVVTHPAPALSCGCEIIQHQGVVPVCRVRRG
jgi:hypothetical protein